MGFKDLFKVRNPGHGEKVEAAVKKAIQEARAKRFEQKDSTYLSKDKKNV